AQPHDVSTAHAGQLAYVMYTSGSTGTPKGVAVTHRNIVSLAWDRHARSEAHRRFLFQSPHAFDAATYEVWVPLLTGGQVVVAPAELTPRELTRVTEEHGVTAVFITAALFRLFAEESPDCFAGLREVWTGGEAPSLPAVERVLRACPDTVVVNVYGPTEVTTFAAAQVLTPEHVRAGVAPIGPPLDNTRAYVLDGFLRPVPVGAPGELYLAGDGVARGYYGRPGLTAGRFVADPFEPGGRMYRTGDTVRWNGNGEIEFIGRVDNQIKIRGFRVELGEIETALRLFPGVSEAVVVVHEAHGTRGLVAYLVADGAEEAELRRFLGERLPGYMVPSRFVMLDALPINANGKIDRRALPDPGAGTGTETVAPRTEPERVLAGIWSEVLGVADVGVTDDFFTLGGDSILSMKVVSRARARGLVLSAKDVFVHPTVAELAAAAEAVSLQNGYPQTSAPRSPGRAAGLGGDGAEDVYPLTAMQSGMLFDALMARDSGLHLIQFDLVLDGVDDPEALVRAWQRAVDRDPILRTAVVWEDVDTPVQVVHERATLPVVHLDWRELPEQGRREALRRLLDEDTARGVDFTEAPLSRLYIARIGDTAVRVVWSVHHIVIDGWSASVLLGDILADYAAVRDGEPQAAPPGGGEPAPPPRRAFRDYVDWLGRRDEPAAEDYWRERLTGFDTQTKLAFDRQPGEGYRPRATRSLQVDLPEELAAAIASRAQATRLTMNTLVQGAWAILLSRYSGERDVCFGATVSTRPADLDGVDAITGMLINTLPVRLEVDNGRDLLSWLRETQREQAAAREFDWVPLPRMQAWSGVPAGVNLFDSVLVFQNYPFNPDMAPDRLDLRHMAVEFMTNYPIGLSVFPGRTLSMRLLYDPELFDLATIERVSRHLLTLLESFAADPRRVIGEVSMLGREEHRMLVREWSGKPAGYSIERRMDEVISERARRWPGAVAVERGEDRLTYAELETRANRLAQYLTGLGVASDVRVGVAVERGPDLVVAILGVLKAGGAYVPLDPDYPPERLRVMIAESGPAVVLTHEHLSASFATAPVRTVCLDRDWPVVAGHPDRVPDTPRGPRDLAYVVYTSGSTGRPKGVMVEHRSLYNTVEAVRDLWLTHDSRVFQLCPMSFDAASLDLFSTLAAGATLVAPVAASGYGGAQLIEELRTKAVTAVTMPPTVLPALDAAALPNLEFVRVGGEVLTSEMARIWSRGRRLVNNYGPSEGAIAVTLFPVRPGTEYDNVPIGGPIPNDRVYVLDDRLSPVPVGVTGELYIGGDAVARGYIGRPDLTAERFVADPFGPPGARLYRSGDLVRWNADGTLEFAGRVDDQIKIRGFRVELREVENVLAGHDGVAETAVVVRQDLAGNKRLIAYWVPAPGVPAPTADELRAHLSGFLPDYMVPAAFVPMTKLPLNRNGKLDREALPDPGTQDDTGDGYLPPRNPTEAALCRIWSEVLAIDPVGVEDNFFDLGGDSISSVRLVSRMRGAFGVDISPNDLFDRPRIAALAERIQVKILENVSAAASGIDATHGI
uniref:non-ribosomal peptide synthetase n=2 Tax=Microbispora siamensis TaxID=564413 RepID=UPI0019501741